MGDGAAKKRRMDPTAIATAITTASAAAATDGTTDAAANGEHVVVTDGATRGSAVGLLPKPPHPLFPPRQGGHNRRCRRHCCLGVHSRHHWRTPIRRRVRRRVGGVPVVHVAAIGAAVATAAAAAVTTPTRVGHHRTHPCGAWGHMLRAVSGQGRQREPSRRRQRSPRNDSVAATQTNIGRTPPIECGAGRVTASLHGRSPSPPPLHPPQPSLLRPPRLPTQPPRHKRVAVRAKLPHTAPLLSHPRPPGVVRARRTPPRVTVGAGGEWWRAAVHNSPALRHHHSWEGVR